ncbi:CvpA family protein [Anaerosalibacter massiliensis]|uniref:CvpA family protein n=1 Tax=Anaerosalibacter massiliensis TaxID=1347392 RepID=A0A9X2MIQ8_9FIRM|nr:CvpA family protein [Anaerosalibacter massiliensis]MCR2044389.1 CvpA family protein [Anaerosalibacter massiliensis]
MNWVDYLIIFIIIINIIRSTKIGLVRSIFSILRLLVSIYVAKLYYPALSGYIIKTPFLHKGFEKFFGGIINILFYGKIKEGEGPLYNIASQGLTKIGINIISILIIYLLVRWLLGYLERFISFLFKAPILKQLNRFGGFLFGLIRGVLILYLIFAIITPIQSIYPQGAIPKAVENSMLSGYFKNHNIIIDFFDIDKSSVFHKII